MKKITEKNWIFLCTFRQTQRVLQDRAYFGHHFDEGGNVGSSNQQDLSGVGLMRGHRSAIKGVMQDETKPVENQPTAGCQL